MHCTQVSADTYLLPTAFRSVVDAGRYGVPLFFVASAVTLFLSMEHRKAEQHPHLNFFIRRFFRIAPLYYIATVLFQVWEIGLTKAIHSPGAYFSPAFFANFFFVHGVRPDWISKVVPGGWSITVEMMFYLLVPILYQYLYKANRAFYFVTGTVLLSSAIRYVVTNAMGFHSKEWVEFLDFYLLNQLPVFGIGIFTYHVLLRQRVPLHLHGSSMLVASLLLGSCLTIGWPFLGGYFAYGVVCSLLFLGLSLQPIPVLVNKFTVYIGRLSYSLYLSHFAVLFILRSRKLVDYLPVENAADALLNYSMRFIIVLALAVAIAELSNRLVEKPFQQLGKRLINSFEKQPLQRSTHKM